MTPLYIVREVARRSTGPAFFFHAPLVVPTIAAARALHLQPEVARTFDAFRFVTKAVVGIGLWQEGFPTLHAALGGRDREEMCRRGTVADMSGVLITAEGEPVTGGITERMIRVSPNRLHAIPDVIGVAYQAEKRRRCGPPSRVDSSTTSCWMPASLRHSLASHDAFDRRRPKSRLRQDSAHEVQVWVRQRLTVRNHISPLPGLTESGDPGLVLPRAASLPKATWCAGEDERGIGGIGIASGPPRSGHAFRYALGPRRGVDDRLQPTARRDPQLVHRPQVGRVRHARSRYPRHDADRFGMML